MRNPRMIQRSAIGIAVAAIAVALCCVAIAADLSADTPPAAVDAEQYAEIMESEAFDLEDLAEGVEIQRRFFNSITPPGVSLFQPMIPTVVPFAATNFADAFLDGLLGEDKNSVAIYPLSLALNPKTRETLVYNAAGKLIATLPGEKTSLAWPPDADPARVTLQLDLLPSEDMEPYLYTESRIAESIASTVAISKSAEDGGYAMNSLVAGQVGFTNILKLTNGNMQLTVTNGAEVAEIFAYTVTHTATVTTNTWGGTNISVDTIWTPVSPSFNGLESAWECRTTNLILTNGLAVWEDSTISSNARVRFYGVATRMDTDLDGLTDGSEYFVHHTNPGVPDTDEDGIPDGAEIDMGLDPLNAADAEEDPDSDHLVNREEYELGLPIHVSNEVTMVYFNSNPPAGLRSLGEPENTEYVTWSNLQAKAVSTIRYKEGYSEFTTTNLPPSNPPKLYLSREHIYRGDGDSWRQTTYGDDLSCTHSEYNHCLKEFDPNGWPSSPSNHICTGYGNLIYTLENECSYNVEGWDYYYDQPTTNVPIVYQHVYSDPCTGYSFDPGTYTNYRDSCYMAYHIWPEIYSHTEAYSSNNWNLWLSIYNMNIYDGYEVEWETLTNEYTDVMLKSYTEADLLLMPSMDELDWGQRWARDNHRQDPYEETLPTNEIYSACLITATNQLQIQDLQYRWSIPTSTGVHYKLMWLEAFRPQDSDTYSDFAIQRKAFTGTGGEYVFEAAPLAHPWDYGTIEPVGFVVKLECSRATNSPMSFGDVPPGPVCYAVWDDEIHAAREDQNKVNSALTIYFKDASTTEGDPADLDVTLSVIPNTLEGVYWSITADSPDSGWLLNADQPLATFRNPTKGGLYKFETSIPGIPTITSQLWLPVSGPDISANFQNEIDYLRNWKTRYLTNLHAEIMLQMSKHHTNSTQSYEAWRNWLTLEDTFNLGWDFDYILISQSLMQDVCGLANVWGVDGAAGDSIRLDVSGGSRPYVTDFAKRNNMGFAMFANAQGVDPALILNGPNALHRLGFKVGTMDDEYTKDSYRAGMLLMNGYSLAFVMDNYGRKMQNPGCRTSKDWPSGDIAATNYIRKSTNLINKLEQLAGGSP